MLFGIALQDFDILWAAPLMSTVEVVFDVQRASLISDY